MKKFAAAALAAVLIVLLCACGDSIPVNKVYSKSDMIGKIVGALNGSTASGYISRYYGDDVNIKLFESPEALAASLKDGSVDCAVCDEKTFGQIKDEFSKAAALDESFIDAEYSIAVSADNKQLLEKLNEALKEISKDGTLSKIVEGWRGGEYVYEYENDETLTEASVAVDPTFYPYAYYNSQEEFAGLETDVVKAICAELGLKPNFVKVDSEKLLYMAESGKVTFAIGRITEDPENSAVLYTDEYMTSKQVIVVRSG